LEKGRKALQRESDENSTKERLIALAETGARKDSGTEWTSDSEKLISLTTFQSPYLPPS